MISTCAKCNGHIFSVQEQAPKGSAFKVYFVECSACGAPIGVLEYANSAALIEILTEKVNLLSREIGQISHDVRQIKSTVARH